MYCLRNSRRPSAKFRNAFHLEASGPPQIAKCFFDRLLLVLARPLPLPGGEHHVFRAAVVSLVLTLVAGQNATLLCSVCCQPPEAASGACKQHQASSPGVTGNDSCRQPTSGATAIVREDVRRGAAPDAPHGIVVAGFQFAPQQLHSTSSRQLGQQAFLRASPLILALRI